jgi:hypothetical protein
MMQIQIGERREPGLVLLFSILTGGIYYLYYIYKVSEETQTFLNEPDTSPMLEVVLSICTCGLYTIYWDYKMAKKIAQMQQTVGLPVTDNSTLYLILNFVGLGIVNSLIEQGHLNEVWNAALRGQSQPTR